MIKVVVFDADKTLWDHSNISALKPPLKILNEDSIEDSNGHRVTLFPDVRETLYELKDMGFYLALATWNIPEKTEAVLSALKLKEYFDLIISREYPFKFIYISHIISMFRLLKKVEIKPNEILFIDDRRVHFGNTWLYVGDVNCLEMWSDVNNHKQIIEKIKTIYNSKKLSEKNYSNA
ncbi:magnesium-dependent phosphatase-1 [Stygiolobus caldivivus]|uniref:Magnesium-dependent phosphatase-1 n=1 Tax=Stygiolobus caldivivus TaxID=2824673 RepID=A0A8D5U9T6_9CREN|nr:magnesium-dependent phosphatase-1 [Stygiolobus caldivivus]BCU71346.1 magnesium-dependent phosphatase-1 [Stygiolobus caldivivus]